MKARKDILSHVERVVVKVGTSLTKDPKKGIHTRVMTRIVKEIADQRRQGRDVVLVSSGAIGAGMQRLGLKRRPQRILEKQATAAVGQVHLMDLYESVFSRHGLTAAQVLLTRHDLQSGQRYFNARNTLETLLDMGVVPIVNENDTVAVDEIRFGDNDRLAALVTNLVRADFLVILTDVDGLMTSDPRKGKGARRIGLVSSITPAVLRLAGGEGSASSTGGMFTKLQAAQMVTEAGEHMVVANGNTPHILRRIFNGEDVGTFFVSQPLDTVKRLRWMPYTQRKAVGVVIRSAAEKRLRRGGERLYVDDVVRVLDEFSAGWAIRISDPKGRTFAKGISQLSSKDLRKAMAAAKKSGNTRPRMLVRYADIAFKKEF